MSIWRREVQCAKKQPNGFQKGFYVLKGDYISAEAGVAQIKTVNHHKGVSTIFTLYKYMVG